MTLKLPFIYTRISSDPLALRAGVRRQLDDALAVTKKRGWDVPVPGGEVVEPRVYEDNDTSAYKGIRPQFEQMLIDMPEAHCLVAYDLDRLLRQPRDLERLIDRCAEIGLILVATAQGDLDLASHDGQLHARILAAVAKKESDDKSRRIKRALLDRRERGLWTGSKPPLGYVVRDGTLQLDEQLCDVIRAGIQDLVHGRCSVNELAAELDITSTGLRKTLLGRSVIGRNAHGILGGWEPLITDLDQAQLREVFERCATGPNTRGQHWLSGVLVCGAERELDVVVGASADVDNGAERICGHKMAFVGGSGTGFYGCTACKYQRGNNIGALPTEAVVEGMVLEVARTVLNRPSSTATAQQRRSRARRAPQPTESTDADERLAELARMYAVGELTRAEWTAARDAATPQRRPAPPSTPVVREDLLEVWDSLLPREMQRSALQVLAAEQLQLVVRRPVADYPRRFDKDRIRLVPV